MDESRMQNTIRELSQSPAFTWFAGALCKGPGLYLSPFPTGFGKSYAFTWLMTLFAGGMRRADLLPVLPELSGKKEETSVARILFVSPQIRDCHDAYRKIKERLPDLRPGEVLYIRSTEDTLRDLKLRSSRKTYEAWLDKLTDRLCRGKQGDRSHVLKASLDRLIRVYESFSSQQGDPEAAALFREELNRSLTDFGKEFRDLMHQDPAIKEACRAASGEEQTSSADAGMILRKYILQPGSDYAPIVDFFPAIRRNTARVILMTDRMFACPVKDPVTSGGTAWYEEFTGGGNLIFLDESDRVKADITDGILRTRAKDPDDILHNLKRLLEYTSYENPPINEIGSDIDPASIDKLKQAYQQVHEKFQETGTEWKFNRPFFPTGALREQIQKKAPLFFQDYDLSISGDSSCYIWQSEEQGANFLMGQEEYLQRTKAEEDSDAGEREKNTGSEKALPDSEEENEAAPLSAALEGQSSFRKQDCKRLSSLIATSWDIFSYFNENLTNRFVQTFSAIPEDQTLLADRDLGFAIMIHMLGFRDNTDPLVRKIRSTYHDQITRFRYLKKQNGRRIPGDFYDTGFHTVSLYLADRHAQLEVRQIEMRQTFENILKQLMEKNAVILCSATCMSRSVTNAALEYLQRLCPDRVFAPEGAEIRRAADYLQYDRLREKADFEIGIDAEQQGDRNKTSRAEIREAIEQMGISSGKEDLSRKTRELCRVLPYYMNAPEKTANYSLRRLLFLVKGYAFSRKNHARSILAFNMKSAEETPQDRLSDSGDHGIYLKYLRASFTLVETWLGTGKRESDIEVCAIRAEDFRKKADDDPDPDSREIRKRGTEYEEQICRPYREGKIVVMLTTPQSAGTAVSPVLPLGDDRDIVSVQTDHRKRDRDVNFDALILGRLTHVLPAPPEENNPKISAEENAFRLLKCLLVIEECCERGMITGKQKYAAMSCVCGRKDPETYARYLRDTEADFCETARILVQEIGRLFRSVNYHRVISCYIDTENARALSLATELALQEGELQEKLQNPILTGIVEQYGRKQELEKRARDCAEKSFRNLLGSRCERGKNRYLHLLNHLWHLGDSQVPLSSADLKTAGREIQNYEQVREDLLRTGPFASGRDLAQNQNPETGQNYFVPVGRELAAKIRRDGGYRTILSGSLDASGPVDILEEDSTSPAQERHFSICVEDSGILDLMLYPPYQKAAMEKRVWDGTIPSRGNLYVATPFGYTNIWKAAVGEFVLALSLRELGVPCSRLTDPVLFEKADFLLEGRGGLRIAMDAKFFQGDGWEGSRDELRKKIICEKGDALSCSQYWAINARVGQKVKEEGHRFLAETLVTAGGRKVQFLIFDLFEKQDERVSITQEFRRAVREVFAPEKPDDEKKKDGRNV